MMRGMLKVVALFALLTLMLMLSAASSAQGDMERAAQLLITADHVSLRRSETAVPLPLPRDALAVIGIGDQVQTDSHGRALIRIEDSLDVLVMPETAVDLTGYTFSDGQVQVQISVEGHVIVGEAHGDLPVAITVNADQLVVYPAGMTAIWTHYEGGDVLTVQGASSGYEVRGGGLHELNDGEGLYVDSSQVRIIPLKEKAAFLHAAQLIGILFGCPAHVIRTGGEALNLRVAPGLSASAIGFAEENASVAVMGSTVSANWFRVQRFSGFGWMFGYYLDKTCANLATYPNTAFERNLELRDVQPEEAQILEPFYGTPETNPWVYRSFRQSPYSTVP